MKSTTVKLFLLTIVSIFIAGSPAFAADNDQGKNQTTPPGWVQGDKTGWEGDTPPGLTEEKLDKKKKAGKKAGKQKAQLKKEGENAKHGAGLKKQKVESEMEAEKKKSTDEIEKAKKIKTQSDNDGS